MNVFRLEARWSEVFSSRAVLFVLFCYHFSELIDLDPAFDSSIMEAKAQDARPLARLWFAYILARRNATALNLGQDFWWKPDCLGHVCNERRRCLFCEA